MRAPRIPLPSSATMQPFRRLANQIDNKLSMQFFGFGPKIFHFPFANFHFLFTAKWKMANQKW
jgi:hypothetical protein